MKKVLIIFGTRPEAIKIAPVIAEMRKHPDQICPIICVTAQHRQMLDQVFSLFRIEPDIDLNLMEENQQLPSFSSKALLSLTQVVKETKPDMILIQGDTTTAMVSALVGFYARIPVGHMEAGLRTYNIEHPFPEEANRRIISVLSSYHFAPTQRAFDFLLQEGVFRESIYLTGNTVIDSLLKTLIKIKDENYVSEILSFLNLNNNLKFILVTAHRRESFGRPLREICQALRVIVKRHRDVQIVYPVHLNPNVYRPVYLLLSKEERIHLVPPLNYVDLCYLMYCSYLILTDSGGIQEEAPSLAKPVMVMRRTTERPEAIEAGVAKLVGTTQESIVRAVEVLLENGDEYRKMTLHRNPFGDGKASERIVNILLGQPYEPFQPGKDKQQ
jgi:UDP-N-acetylglucosamine 2-epimerase (non-hydrolysing)